MAFIQYAACCTALGNAGQTCVALNQGQVALKLLDVPDIENEEKVPLAMMADGGTDDEPRWMEHLRQLAAGLPNKPWGTERYPIFLTSSNYGIDHLYAYSQQHDPKVLGWSTPHALTLRFREAFGWGPQITVLSHACVTGQLGLLLAERAVERGQADAALVFSFDFLSPFVIGGFNALKILNGGMPSPYADAEIGSIGLGEGAGAVVISSESSPFRIKNQTVFNEMFHFTSNAPDGSGFKQILASCIPDGETPKLWVKGHGTGTLEAGALESRAVEDRLPGAPLMSWKGSIGHTLGSCAVVELAIALEAMRGGKAPGNVGGKASNFTDSIQLETLDLESYEGALLLSNAFGGAHAAMWISHE
ncbi:MAG: beta-ketoacyl synthase N-terminal-like domain-containing protein [Opitutaceae bacterium]